MMNTLLPITNFYNELVMSLGIRDPQIALDHKRLFTAPGSFSDDNLRTAFLRYNSAFRKIDPERLGVMADAPPGRKSLRERIAGMFGGGNR